MKRIVSAVVAITWIVSAPAFAQFPYKSTTVATSGEPAPGAPGRTFAAFGAPYVEAFRVMFPAALDGSPQGAVDGLWGQGLNNSLQLLARKGDPAPGLPGQSFSSFDS